MKSGNFEYKIQQNINQRNDLKSSSLVDSSNEHYVQKRSEPPYVPSFPSEYYPGVINPLKRRITKQMLNIDTRFRDHYRNSLASNFNVVLPMTYNNIYSMQLTSIELPLTYNLISEKLGNNYFYICEGNIENKNNATSNFVTITIPDGSYFVARDLIDAINTAISKTIYNGKIVFGFSYDPIFNGKTEVNVPTDFEFSLIFQTAANQVYMNSSSSLNGCNTTVQGTANANANPSVVGSGFHLGNSLSNQQLPMKLGWILGFREGVYTSNSTFTSEAMLDIRGPSYLYLVVDDFNNNVTNGFFSAFRNSVLNKNILARITLDKKEYLGLELPEEVNQNNLKILTSPREYFGPVNITTLNIQLLDAFGRIVDLNYMDFSFCLTLTKQYDI